jgi:DNA-binding MarR family transcriptional regulator
MEEIKNSFKKVKQDISFLYNEIDSIKKELYNLSTIIKKISFLTQNNLQNMQNNLQNTPNHLKNTSTHTSTHLINNSTQDTHPINNKALEDLKASNLRVSTRNHGVPTDRQTDRQTNRHTQNTQKFYNSGISLDLEKLKNIQYLKIKENPTKQQKKDTFDKTIQTLENLDNLKKEIRLKFKDLTTQEFKVFALLYNLEEKREIIDYKLIAKHLNLTESSARDYIGRLIKKGIPIQKNKLKNKQILLSVSEELKKIASLNSIIELREI